MAGQYPETAIWFVKNRDAAHDVLDAMNDPSEDLTRVEKSYSRCLPKQRFRIDEPGVPEICAFQSLRDSILA